MTTFKIIRHIENDESYQGINLTEFAFVVDEKMDNDEIVDTFIRTNNFSYDSLRDRVKKEPDKGFLRRAFNIDKIKNSDFRKFNKDETANFLYDFLNEPDWGDYRNDFILLLNKYLEIHKQFGDNDFYVISKDWFGKGDEKVIEPESWCYTYYFLIISVDRNQNLLTLTEWTYD